MKIVCHIVQLLGEWMELFPYDFRDERMMAHVRTITQKCVQVDPSVSQSYNGHAPHVTLRIRRA